MNNRIIDVRTITEDGPTIHFSATEADKKKLAQRFELSKIDSFQVDGHFGYDELITFDGKMHVKAERTCVITLKPFWEITDVPIHLSFSDNPKDIDDNPEEDILLIQKGKIDLFDVFAEEFGLNLNPFPKSVDSYLDYYDTPVQESDNPFAVLKKLKKGE